MIYLAVKSFYDDTAILGAYNSDKEARDVIQEHAAPAIQTIRDNKSMYLPSLVEWQCERALREYYVVPIEVGAPPCDNDWICIIGEE